MKYREDNMAKLLPNEIALDNYEDVNAILPILVNNGYAVMVTREENLWIVNYIYACDNGCDQSDRNNVVLMNREAFYETLDNDNSESKCEGTDYD